jgi:nitrate/nitrite-specific signal transduction histidine kinase
VTQSNNRISTKIKILGAGLIFTILSVIALTIYLNQKNTKDSLIINIAGKERMLTQKISKNIFYLYQKRALDFNELNNAVEEFEYIFDTLKEGNKFLGIAPAPTNAIAQQISKVAVLWNNFNKNVQSFKKILLLKDTKNEKKLKVHVNSIYNSNNNLLKEVDNLVTMYTIYTEQKTHTIKNFQYFGAFILFLLIVYSLQQLRVIESHAKEFLKYSKKIITTQTENKPIEYIQIDAEKEIVEVSDTLNCFISKINSAMQYSEEAVAKSQLASLKLDEISDEFGRLLDKIEDSQALSSQLSQSEDIAIQSSEYLLQTTQKLTNLKLQLDNLKLACK